jgi:hypothetical protein
MKEPLGTRRRTVAVLRIARPREVSTAEYDALTAKLDLDEHPPEGMLLHTACEVEGELVIVEVWLSEEQATEWDRTRRVPTVERVLSKPAAAAVSYQVHNLVVPAWAS